MPCRHYGVEIVALSAANRVDRRMGCTALAKQIVVLASLTHEELDQLGPQFNRAYPVDKTPCLGELLHAIDLADRNIWQERDKASSPAQNCPMVVVIDPARSTCSAKYLATAARRCGPHANATEAGTAIAAFATRRWRELDRASGTRGRIAQMSAEVANPLAEATYR